MSLLRNLLPCSVKWGKCGQLHFSPLYSEEINRFRYYGGIIRASGPTALTRLGRGPRLCRYEHNASSLFNAKHLLITWAFCPSFFCHRLHCAGGFVSVCTFGNSRSNQGYDILVVVSMRPDAQKMQLVLAGNDSKRNFLWKFATREEKVLIEFELNQLGPDKINVFLVARLSKGCSTRLDFRHTIKYCILKSI